MPLHRINCVQVEEENRAAEENGYIQMLGAREEELLDQLNVQQLNSADASNRDAAAAEFHEAEVQTASAVNTERLLQQAESKATVILTISVRLTSFSVFS